MWSLDFHHAGLTSLHFVDLKNSHLESFDFRHHFAGHWHWDIINWQVSVKGNTRL